MVHQVWWRPKRMQTNTIITHQLVSGSSCVRMELSILSVCASLCSSSFNWFSAGKKEHARERGNPISESLTVTKCMFNIKTNKKHHMQTAQCMRLHTCFHGLFGSLCQFLLLCLVTCRLHLEGRGEGCIIYTFCTFQSCNLPKCTCRYFTFKNL